MTTPSPQIDEAGEPDQSAEPDPWKPTSRGRLWVQAIAGLGWLAVVALGMTAALQLPFQRVLGVVIAFATANAGLMLAWMFWWARLKETRPGQYQIGSLFFITTFLAIFASAVRWVMVHGPVRDASWWHIASGLLFISLFSLRLIAGLVESVLWTFVWLVRRRVVQTWLRRRKLG